MGERKLEIRLITASQPTSIVVFYLIAGCKGFPDSSVCVLPMVQMGYACVCVCVCVWMGTTQVRWDAQPLHGDFQWKVSDLQNQMR